MAKKCKLCVGTFVTENFFIRRIICLRFVIHIVSLENVKMIIFCLFYENDCVKDNIPYVQIIFNGLTVEINSNYTLSETVFFFQFCSFHFQ